VFTAYVHPIFPIIPASVTMLIDIGRPSETAQSMLRMISLSPTYGFQSQFLLNKHLYFSAPGMPKRAQWDDDDEETKLCQPLVATRHSPAQGRASVTKMPVGRMGMAPTIGDNLLFTDITERNLTSRIEGDNVVNIDARTDSDAPELIPEITALALNCWRKECYGKLPRT
jgi:hypothetical protein